MPSSSIMIEGDLLCLADTGTVGREGREKLEMKEMYEPAEN